MIGLVGAAGAMAVDKNYGTEKRDLFMIAYGGVSTLGMVLPHSRGDESEADIMGLQYAAQAGYNPNASVTFWQRMAAANGGPQIPKWLSTHPPGAQRIADLRAAIPRFMPIYDANLRRYQ